MSLDRRLVESIKANFARKSAEHLRAVARADEPDRWSPEALAAAAEVLDDRRAGLAAEPAAPEPDPDPPPSSGLAVGTIAFAAGLNLLTLPLGFLVIPLVRPYVVDPFAADRPVSFGPESAWLAVEGRDTAAVSAALGLRRPRAATWVEGLADAARPPAVFVTPPLGDWTLVTGAALFPPEQVGEFVTLLLDRLSRAFRGAQYYCSHTASGLHAWARAERGRLLRGYAWYGGPGRALWDEGEPTKAERYLGFRFAGGDPAADGPAVADEDCVLQVANLWSVDPSGLNEEFQEPVTGLVGDVAWTAGGDGSASR